MTHTVLIAALVSFTLSACTASDSEATAHRGPASLWFVSPDYYSRAPHAQPEAVVAAPSQPTPPVSTTHTPVPAESPIPALERLDAELDNTADRLRALRRRLLAPPVTYPRPPT